MRRTENSKEIISIHHLIVCDDTSPCPSYSELTIQKNTTYSSVFFHKELLYRNFNDGGPIQNALDRLINVVDGFGMLYNVRYRAKGLILNIYIYSEILRVRLSQSPPDLKRAESVLLVSTILSWTPPCVSVRQTSHTKWLTSAIGRLFRSADIKTTLKHFSDRIVKTQDDLQSALLLQQSVDIGQILRNTEGIINRLGEVKSKVEKEALEIPGNHATSNSDALQVK